MTSISKSLCVQMDKSVVVTARNARIYLVHFGSLSKLQHIHCSGPRI